MDESVPTLARCVPSAVPAGASLGWSKGTLLGAFGDAQLTMGAESGVSSGGADLHGAIGRDGEIAVEEASEAERHLSRLPLVCSPCAWPRWLIGSLPPAHCFSLGLKVAPSRKPRVLAPLVSSTLGEVVPGEVASATLQWLVSMVLLPEVRVSAGKIAVAASSVPATEAERTALQ